MAPGEPASGAAHASDACPPRRPPRADARRNRELVLQAARELIAAKGLGASIDEIACRAGVGVGTVYRAFPTKEALYEAIVVSHLEQMRDSAAALSEAGEPGDAFFDFLLRVAEAAREKRDLIDALGCAGIDLKERAAGVFAELRAGAEVLLERAKGAGAVRTDVTVDDLWGLVGATCAAEGDRGPRLLRFVCDGLRPPPASS